MLKTKKKLHGEIMQTQTDDLCPLSKRVDGPWHNWHFDNDDPRIICCYCDEMRDALTGRIIRLGKRG